MSERLLIGEVAERAGVSADTVRHYERKGLLGTIARDDSGYRRYDEMTIRRVRVVRRALAFGFTLDELARVFRQRAANQPPCRAVRALAAQKLTDVERRIDELHALRDALARLVRSWDEQLERTPPNAFAHLLETLDVD